MPATAGVVRDISAGLLTIHGQHDSTSLTNPATHLALLDQYAQDGAEYAAYHRCTALLSRQSVRWMR